ncbi:methylenetetrahydrofolate reductase [Deinococcus multiflagellatus]|uniref:Methylenetetrahydrofolate reductase n=1 Tax=Deinococcus multiflagellatus TaxID=1656887 RepID=A0ABW1ZHM4_9DEIO
MTRVSVELVPRSRSGLRAELAEVAAHLRGVDTINVPDLTRYSLRSWAGCGFARPGFAAIPHLRAVDFNPREPLPFLPLLAQHGIDEVLVITGDAPADMSARVYDVDAVDLIRRLKREAPHLRVYAGLDPYRQSFVRERDYLARKLDAGACGLFTQPFFDLRVADTWADLVPEGLPVWWGPPASSPKPVSTTGGRATTPCFPARLRPRWRATAPSRPTCCTLPASAASTPTSCRSR